MPIDRSWLINGDYHSWSRTGTRYSGPLVGALSLPLSFKVCFLLMIGKWHQRVNHGNKIFLSRSIPDGIGQDKPCLSWYDWNFVDLDGTITFIHVNRFGIGWKVDYTFWPCYLLIPETMVTTLKISLVLSQYDPEYL